MEEVTPTGTVVAKPVDDAINAIRAHVTTSALRFGRVRGGAWAELVLKIEDIADPAVDAIIATVPESNIPALIEIIKDRRKGLPLSSSTGAQITSLCGQLLGFGAAGLALAIGFIDKIEKLAAPIKQILFVLGIFYVELIALSLVIIVTYLLQATFRYPYLYFERIGNAWPYFYYASVSPEISRSPIQSGAARLRATGSYAADLLRFAQRSVTETPRQRLRHELQQYFLLIAYQSYSHQFSLRLGNMFVYGLFGSIVGAILVAVVSHAYPR